MSELRAPDPTLDALGDTPVTVDSNYGVEPLPAHRWGTPSPCRSFILEGDRINESARFARWFAVPCRECFPEAPEPGHVWSQFVMGLIAGHIEPYATPVPHLSWQLEGNHEQ